MDWSAPEWNVSVERTATDKIMKPKEYDHDRGSLMDFAHDLFVGSAEAVDLVGGGFETAGVENPLRNWSNKMREADLYRPDTTTYYGNDSFLKKVFSGMVQSAPASLSPLIAGAAGTAVGGPVAGGAAGITTLLGMFGGGTYAQALDEGASQGLTGKELESFARRQAASEVLTETIGDIVALGAGGIFKQPVSQIIRSMNKGDITPDKIISEIAGQIGVKRTLGRLMGASTVEGGTEVVNSLYQNYNRANNGLETPEEDLALTFAIGAAMGGTIGAGASVLTSSKNRARKRIIQDALASPDYDTRKSAYMEISDRLKDPEMKQAWALYDPKVSEGPMTQEDFTDDQQRYADTDVLLDKVINDPQSILQEAGVIKNPETNMYEPSTQYHTKLKTGPLDPYLEEALTNDPMWVPEEERDTLKNRVERNRRERELQEEAQARADKMSRPSATPSTTDIGGRRSIPVDTIGDIERTEAENDRSQYDAELPLAQRVALAEQKAQELDASQREPVMKIVKPKETQDTIMEPEKSGAAGREIASRSAYTKGKTGVISDASKDKLTISEVADLESRVKGIDYNEALQAEVQRREAKTPETAKATETVEVKPETPKETTVVPRAPKVEEITEEQPKGISQVSRTGKVSDGNVKINFSDGTVATQISLSRNFKVDYADGSTGYVKGKASDIEASITNDRKKTAAIERADARLDETGEVKTGRATVAETRAVSYGEAETTDEQKLIVQDFVANPSGEEGGKSIFDQKVRVDGLTLDQIEDAKMEAISNLIMRNDTTQENVAKLYAREFNREVSRIKDNKGKNAMGVSIDTPEVQATVSKGAGAEQTEDIQKTFQSSEPEAKEIQKAKSSETMKWEESNNGTRYVSGQYEINSVRDGMKLRWTLEGPQGSLGIFDVLEEAQEFAKSNASRRTVRRTKAEGDAARAAREAKEEESLETADTVEETEQIEVTVADLINRKYKEKTTQAFANFLAKIMKADRMMVKVILDPYAGPSSYDPNTDTVTIRGRVNEGTVLHEVFHAITARELLDKPNSAEAQELRTIMEEVREYLVENNLVSPEDIERYRIRTTSKGFKSLYEIDNGLNNDQDQAFGGMMPVMYALTNEREFLAQIANSADFRTLLSKLPSSNPKKSLWDKVVDVLMKALGLFSMDRSRLNDALELAHKIAQQELGETFGNTGAFDESLEAPKVRQPKDYEQEAKDSLETEDLSTLGKIKSKKSQVTNDVLKWTKDTFQPIADALEKLDRKIAGRLGAMDAKNILNYKRYKTMVEPFLRELQGLTEVQQRQVSMALYNSRYSEAEKFIAKDSLDNMKEVLRELDLRARKVGMQYGRSKASYFPRTVTDLNAYLDHMKTTDDNAFFEETFRARERALGRKLTEADRIAAMASVLSSGNITAIPRPGATKERTVPFVNSDNFKFYGKADNALISHIFDMNEKIGYREFAGGNTRARNLKKAERLAKELENNLSDDIRREKLAELNSIEEALTNEEKELENSVANLVINAGKSLKSAEGMELVDLLKARLKPRGPSGAIDLIRNVGYATAMGNFMSAITQLGDIPIAFYDGYKKAGVKGLLGTASATKEAFKTIGKIISTDIGKKTGLTPQFDLSGSFVSSMDFTNSLREFSQGSYSSNLLDQLFKYSGLKYTDLIGKETFMQSSFKNLESIDLETFKDRYGPMFDNIEEAYSNRINKDAESTKMIVFAELSRWQPVSMSQQSKTYLSSGNGRIFYMLKTFQLRATNAAIREGLREYEASERTIADKMAMGARIGSILAIYAIAGASVDELKDLIKGRENALSDNVLDNAFSLFLISTFDAEMGLERDQLITKIVQGNLPPLRWIDQLGGDLYSIFDEDKPMKFKTLNLVPFIGNLIYGYSDAGRTSEFKWRKEQLREDLESAVKNGESLTDFSSRVSDYNEWASESGEPTINLFQMLQRIK